MRHPKERVDAALKAVRTPGPCTCEHEEVLADEVEALRRDLEGVEGTAEALAEKLADADAQIADAVRDAIADERAKVARYLRRETREALAVAIEQRLHLRAYLYNATGPCAAEVVTCNRPPSDQLTRAA